MNVARASAGALLSERRLFLRVLDYAALAAALYISTLSSSGSTEDIGRIDTWLMRFVSMSLLWTVSSSVFDCYKAGVPGQPRRGVLSAFGALSMSFVAYLLVAYAAPQLLLAQVNVPVWAALALILIVMSRTAYARFLTAEQFRRRVVVVGEAVHARSGAMFLRAEASKEYDVLGLVSPATERPESSAYLPVLGSYADLAGVVRARGAAEVVLAEGESQSATLMAQVMELYQTGTEVRHISDLYEEITGRIAVRHVGSHWIAALPRRGGTGRAFDIAKRCIDVVVALAALVLASPLMLAIALAIRLEGDGPVIYRQKRQGYLGTTFDVLKFRTMRADAEAGRAVWAAAGDSRRTRLGKVLRPIRLDELPQLWNVVVGDMSLIGPRPERPEFVAELQKAIPFFRARMLVRPGITGWAQVNFMYAASIDDAVEKLQYDLYYVKHRSAYLDLVIALKTIGVLLRAGGQ